MDKKPAVINIIWLSLILIATVVAAYTGKMEAMTKASFDAAKNAVTLAIGLIGVMALWLGIVKVAEAAGLMEIIARALRPLMIRLFPEVPAEHPAMSAMIMNFAANALGLGNAATPLGIKAMMELDRLSPVKGQASNAMCLFLAINTSNISILPLGVIGIRAAAGAANPAAIFLPTLIATSISTMVAVIAAKLLATREEPMLAAPKDPDSTKGLAESDQAAGMGQNLPAATNLSPPGQLGRGFIWLVILALLGGFLYQFGLAPSKLAFFKTLYSFWLIPLLMSSLLIFGFLKGVKVYETLCDGAKDGFDTAKRIIPYLVAIMVAVAMFRESGAFDFFIALVSPVTNLIGMPADALPMVLMRPLSGSGAFGILTEVVNRDPNGFTSFLVSTLQGSTETTFYILAVYFGSVGISKTRHALPAALIADAAGTLAALLICHLAY
jgi:spore maturation protein SpmA